MIISLDPLQIRSHAQKSFAKAEQRGESIPPPRPKQPARPLKQQLQQQQQQQDTKGKRGSVTVRCEAAREESVNGIQCQADARAVQAVLLCCLFCVLRLPRVSVALVLLGKGAAFPCILCC
jgi:hypothetical protein